MRAPKGTTYIYALHDPRNNDVRYIGKSNWPLARLKAHVKNAGHSHHANWIRQLVSIGLTPVLSIIENPKLEDWEKVEIFWIHYCRTVLGCDLVNAAEGGKGSHGWSPSMTQRVKLGLARKGRRVSELTRQRMRDAAKLRYEDPKIREMLSKAAKGKPKSDKHKAAIKLGWVKRKINEKVVSTIKLGWIKRKANAKQFSTKS